MRIIASTARPMISPGPKSKNILKVYPVNQMQ
jgi:hypothetical protein